MAEHKLYELSICQRDAIHSRAAPSPTNDPATQIHPVCASLPSRQPAMLDSPDDAAQTERVTKPCTATEGHASISKRAEHVDAAGESSSEPAAALPKLSAVDFSVYNQMATHMDYYVRAVLHRIAVLFPLIAVLFPFPHRISPCVSFRPRWYFCHDAIRPG